MRKTKIICTLGPAVDSIERLRDLMINGMDCARLNFSHGTHEEQKKRMDNVKMLRERLNLPIPILLDTKGPEIRLRDFKDGSIMVNENDIFTFSPDSNYVGDQHKVGLTYPYLAKSVKPGNNILVDDGKVGMEVIEVLDNGEVKCKVINPGKLSNKKSINIPNVIVDMPYISQRDREDILFGIKEDVDYIAASFVRRKQDVLDLRQLLKENGGENIKIISKIENTEGIENMDEIIDVSDGIMVARGDMGVDVPFKNLPQILKKMISNCYHQVKIVVTATQILESMTKNPRPTRAEVSDVANAIYDRTTAIMLSGESAAGDYPIEAVRTMSAIAIAAEESIDYKKRFYRSNISLGTDNVNAIANCACNASFQINADAIVTVTKGGITASMLSCYRPKCPIIAVTMDPKACRQLNLAWNVKPIDAVEQFSTDEIFKHGIEKALETRIVSKGDRVIVTGGSAIGKNGTDTLSIHVL